MGRSRLRGYGLALVAVAVAVGVQLLLQQLLGPRIPFMAYFPAVLFSAVWGGLGPGLMATLLSALSVFHFQLDSTLDRATILLFLPVALSFVWVAVRLRGANQNARSARQQAQLLADAGVVLSSSLDSQTTLTNLANLVLPRMADWAAIDILDAAGTLERVNVVRRDPARGEVVLQVQPEVILQGKSDWTSAYLCVPLKTSTQTLGALTLAYAESGRSYSQRDVALAEDLGRRAAVAVENARLREDAERLLAAERAARTEAERAGRLKDEFLATLSHELRTPLNAILGWTHILSNGGLEPEEVEQGLETIDRNARAQARIIEDLLDMSKIMQGKIHLDVQDIDLVKITQAAVQAVQPSCSVKKLDIQCSLPVAAPTRGDAIRLQQVVWNLLSNAIKFSPVEGRIEVKLTVEDEHFQLAVQDYGAGIKPEFLPHLFEKFRQQDGTTTRGVGGMGLGLSIARQILEFHGGSVRAYSQGKDTGSLFVVQLPIVHNAGNDTARENIRVKLPGLRILVVEDDPDAREFLVRLLKDRKAEVTSAASADQALDLLSRQTVDLLISDIGMPHKDGYQLMREVRAQPAWAALPAIAVTAFARREDKEATLAAGYQLHITKPIDATRLLKAAHSLTGGAPQAVNPQTPAG